VAIRPASTPSLDALRLEAELITDDEIALAAARWWHALQGRPLRTLLEARREPLRGQRPRSDDADD
jgi:hypothetical protein